MNPIIYPWQQAHWEQFNAMLQQQRFPQALLLHGPQGVGKLDFAHAFAARLLCEQPHTGVACSECRGCQLQKAGTHPDFYSVMPEANSKTIKVDQIRQLIDKLANTSQRNGFQVVVLAPIEVLHRAAANALLKTLEEPTGTVIFILVAHQLGPVPATILSRCQRHYFAANDSAETIAWVRQQIDAKVDPLLMLHLADYAPLRAVALAQTDYVVLRDTILQHLLKITRDHANPIAPVGQYVKHDFELLLYAVLTLAMDVARLQLGVQVNYVVNQDRAEPLRNLGQTLRATLLQRFIEKIHHAYRLFITGTHVNVQLLLENLFIEWAKLG